MTLPVGAAKKALQLFTARLYLSVKLFYGKEG